MDLKKIEHILDYMENNFTELYSHSERTAMLCYCLAKDFDLLFEEIEIAYLSGLLHEIGKMYIPNKIGIGNNEFINNENIYSRFTNCILNQYDGFDRVIKVIEQHQENFDGSGIPGNYNNNEIKSISTILRICDFYDTQKSNGLKHEEVTKILRKNSNIFFPSKIITPFIKTIIKNNLKD